MESMSICLHFNNDLVVQLLKYNLFNRCNISLLEVFPSSNTYVGLKYFIST